LRSTEPHLLSYIYTSLRAPVLLGPNMVKTTQIGLRSTPPKMLFYRQLQIHHICELSKMLRFTYHYTVREQVLCVKMKWKISLVMHCKLDIFVLTLL